MNIEKILRRILIGFFAFITAIVIVVAAILALGYANPN